MLDTDIKMKQSKTTVKQNIMLLCKVCEWFLDLGGLFFAYKLTLNWMEREKWMAWVKENIFFY